MSIKLAIDLLAKGGHETLAKAIADERDAYLVEIDRLRLLIGQFNRLKHGPKSEKLEAQLLLAIEDTEQRLAQADAAREQEEEDKPAAERRPRPPRNNNRGALPESLPREHITIEPEDKSCPCCGGEMHVMSEDVTEMLDFVPAQFRVKAYHRPKYACRGCQEAIVQAPAPERPITGGMATEGLLAQVLVSKYADHCPLYRQAAIYRRAGITLDRSTLADWVGRSCWWLKPLHDLLTTTVLASNKLFADDTPVPVLDPGRGRTKTGRLWAYARDDRPWQGADPPAVTYIYSDNRKGEHPTHHLLDFKGILQVDGYQSYDTIASKRADGSIVLAYCWTHCRRKFFELHKSLPESKVEAANAPIATEAVQRIAALYAIEDDIRGKIADERRQVRQARSRPRVDEFRKWLMDRLGKISGKSKLAEAIRYALGHWDGLCVFLDDGRVEMDTNSVERTFRPQKLTAKNSLFAGSDSGGVSWSIVASLIETAKLNGVEPYAYLKDILERMVAGHPINRFDQLLPWNWKKLGSPQPA